MAASKVAAQIIAQLQDGTLRPGQVVEIVKAVAKAVRGDREAAVKVVDLVSRGPDGVPGTPDDLLPLATTEALKALLNNALVGQLVDEFSKEKRFLPCCA